MTINNDRMSVRQFFPPARNTQPHSEQLIESKKKGAHIEISDVPGKGNSHIEKMTHPLAGPSESEPCSPYMMYLLGEPSAVAFAEKALQAPRKQLLDKLGIDDTQKKERLVRLNADQNVISRFYAHTAETRPTSMTLNGSPFIEQPPTKPYFFNQKIITPDFTIHRINENAQKTNLLYCKFRDDSGIFFNPAPIKRLEHYNEQIYLKESSSHNAGKSTNKTQYFIEMADFLTQRGTPGDFIVQNPLESSSDKNMPHFQFIPGDVPLPIFYHPPRSSDGSELRIVDWHLPALLKTIDTQQPDWKETTKYLQDQCQHLLSSQHISTTPVFRLLEDKKIDLYMIFKKDCSTEWNMTPHDIDSTPGWLESCGIFIANTPKSEVFNRKGAQEYYATYGVTAEHIDTIKNLFEN
ncbi:Decapping nuclease [Pseudomonas sp. IT-P253]|uniref:hypothetical protein n=1 Tax=Pseudomonas sp. IT-P253 TaxID=3026455 RepID=UPI0039DFF670